MSDPSSDLVVDALRDIARALRELAHQVPPDPARLLRAEEVAEMLQLPLRTVRDQAAAGSLPHRRFGKHYRFSREDVESIIGQMGRTARPQRVARRAA
jgi:excisionase family DNA binding protein